MYTRLYDMHSGGDLKVPPYRFIFIEGPESLAAAVYESRYGRSIYNITCNCCGADYSIYEGMTLLEITAYDRGCRYDRIFREYRIFTTGEHIENFLKRPDVLMIWKKDISPGERRLVWLNERRKT